MTIGNYHIRSFHVILQKQQKEKGSYRNYDMSCLSYIVKKFNLKEKKLVSLSLSILSLQ